MELSFYNYNMNHLNIESENYMKQFQSIRYYNWAIPTCSEDMGFGTLEAYGKEHG
jgi:hypothetical protein